MDEQQSIRILCRRLSRIGWGLLAYFAAGQLLGACALLIPGVAESVLLSTAASYLIVYGVAPLVLWLILRPLPRGFGPELSLSLRALIRTAVFCLGVTYIFNFLTWMLIWALEQLTGLSTGNLLQATADSLPGGLYLCLVGVCAPVFEELIFRKLLLDRLRPFGDRCAILVSGLAFGLFHLNLYQFFYAAALGMIFAGVALKTGKIWHTMLLHACINLVSSGVSWLTEAVPWGDTAAVVLMLALCILAVVIFLCYARTFRYAPPQYPVSGQQVFASLSRAPGIWICLLLSLALGVAVIFFV